MTRAELDSVADMIYIAASGPDTVCVSCGGCEQEMPPTEEIPLADVMEWACTHHEAAS